VLVIAGCAQLVQEPIRICPGKDSAQQALSVLNSQSQQAVPFRAIGQCLFEYREKDGGKHKQNIQVSIWLEPPCRMYVQGSVAVDPRAVVIGSNEQEFWLAVRPKEISSYYWGEWDDAGYVDDLVVDPKIVLEGFGVLATSEHATENESWTLSNEGAYDVLTCHSDNGRVLKRVYIYNCYYLVRRIEYYDDTGEVSAAAELSRYEQLSDGFWVPKRIEIKKRNGTYGTDSIKIRLSSAKAATFSEKLRLRIFRRPEPSGFKHVFKVVEGSIIEQ
jgi:hypothetical protein